MFDAHTILVQKLNNEYETLQRRIATGEATERTNVGKLVLDDLYWRRQFTQKMWLVASQLPWLTVESVLQKNAEFLAVTEGHFCHRPHQYEIAADIMNTELMDQFMTAGTLAVEDHSTSTPEECEQWLAKVLEATYVAVMKLHSRTTSVCSRIIKKAEAASTSLTA